MRAVIAATYPEAMAAHLARIRMEAEGIEAWVENENFASIYPTHGTFTGGVQLKVWEQDAQRATQIVRELHDDAWEAHESRYRACPACGSQNLSPGMGFLRMMLLTFLTVGVYLLFFYRPCRCNACGRRW